jgi:hypothetical protein
MKLISYLFNSLEFMTYLEILRFKSWPAIFICEASFASFLKERADVILENSPQRLRLASFPNFYLYHSATFHPTLHEPVQLVLYVYRN